MRIFIVGGAGYVGTQLAQVLDAYGYNIVVVDNFWYWQDVGPYLQLFSKNVKAFKCKIGDFHDKGYPIGTDDVVILLGCVSNDPSADLDYYFTHDNNYLQQIKFLDGLKKTGATLIYASSSSVYGIKDEEQVTENLVPEPLTQYSKLKLEIEHYIEHLHAIGDLHQYVIVRPATVFGWSERMRLDLIANIMSWDAFEHGRVKVFGGQQMRPLIHIDDMVDAYVALVTSRFHYPSRIYNVGYDNFSCEQIGLTVADVFNARVDQRVSEVDNRSYRLNSDKFKQDFHFTPKNGLEDGIQQMKTYFNDDILRFTPSSLNYNITRMREILNV